MVKYLQPIAKIVDITSYANEMFAAKSNLTGYSMQEILLLDYKTFQFNDQLWSIGVVETFDSNHLLKRKYELLEEMSDEMKKNQLNGILFSIIDIPKIQNFMIILIESKHTVVRRAFNVDINPSSTSQDQK